MRITVEGIRNYEDPIPDTGVLEMLRDEVGEEYGIAWNWQRERWEVFRFRPVLVRHGPLWANGPGLCTIERRPTHVMTVEGEDGEYIGLDRRVITALQRTHVKNWKDPDHWFRDHMEQKKKRQEKADERARERLTCIAQDWCPNLFLKSGWTPGSEDAVFYRPKEHQSIPAGSLVGG